MTHNALAETATPETLPPVEALSSTNAVAIPSYCLALRGATVASANTAAAIYAATRELLTRLVEQNDLALADIASAFFTVTSDLTAAFPAKAARQIGWTHVALLCATEIPVPGSLVSCVRVLVHLNATRPRATYHGVYINGAEKLLEE